MKNTLKDKEIQNLIKKKNIINISMICCFFSFGNKDLKFAFASSKIFKVKAIKNLIKRQLRSIIYKIPDWPKDLNIIFVAKKNFLNFSYEEINKILIIIKEKTKRMSIK